MPLAGVLTVLLASPALAGAARYEPRIVGGADATRPWPAQGYLLIQVEAGTFACAGTLVSGRWFLTAAHCVTDPSDNSILPASAFTVRLGSANPNLGNRLILRIPRAARIGLRPARSGKLTLHVAATRHARTENHQRIIRLSR